MNRDIPTLTSLPQNIPLFVVGVEGFGKLVRLQKAVDEEEELAGGEELIHALIFSLLGRVKQRVLLADSLDTQQQILYTMSSTF